MFHVYQMLWNLHKNKGGYFVLSNVESLLLQWGFVFKNHQSLQNMIVKPTIAKYGQFFRNFLKNKV